MAQMAGYAHGAPCWFQLSANDVAAAKQFYGAVFGWTFRDNPMGPDFVYTNVFKGESSVCGLCRLDPAQSAAGVPPHWDVDFKVDDVDASAAKAVDLGGKVVMPPMDVADLGRLCYITDLEGAGFALWQPGTHKGADAIHEFAANAWVELAARGTAKAAEFYAGLLGWTYVEQETPQPAYIGGSWRPARNGAASCR